jgi:hypothetical protein
VRVRQAGQGASPHPLQSLARQAALPFGGLGAVLHLGGQPFPDTRTSRDALLLNSLLQYSQVWAAVAASSTAGPGSAPVLPLPAGPFPTTTARLQPVGARASPLAAGGGEGDDRPGTARPGTSALATGRSGGLPSSRSLGVPTARSRGPWGPATARSLAPSTSRSGAGTARLARLGTTVSSSPTRPEGASAGAGAGAGTGAAQAAAVPLPSGAEQWGDDSLAGVVVTGFVTATAVSAARLKSMDVIGKQDPYVVFRLPGQNGALARTRPILAGGNDVEWDDDHDPTHSLRFVALHGSTLTLEVSVWDHDVVGSDDRIGGGVVEVPVLASWSTQPPQRHELTVEGPGGEDFGSVTVMVSLAVLLPEAAKAFVDAPARVVLPRADPRAGPYPWHRATPPCDAYGVHVEGDGSAAAAAGAAWTPLGVPAPELHSDAAAAAAALRPDGPGGREGWEGAAAGAAGVGVGAGDAASGDADAAKKVPLRGLGCYAVDVLCLALRSLAGAWVGNECDGSGAGSEVRVLSRVLAWGCVCRGRHACSPVPPSHFQPPPPLPLTHVPPLPFLLTYMPLPSVPLSPSRW